MNKDEYKLYSDLENYHWWFRGRREVLKEILSFIKDKSKKSVLDVGCGAGWNIKLLYNSFKNVHGIDNNSHAVAFSRENSECKVELYDANNLSEIDNYYDLISFLDVLYHKDVVDYVSVLKSSFKILNKGGYLLIADGAFDILSGKHSEHVHGTRRFTRRQLITDLESLGYEIVVARYWGVLLFFIIFLKRRVFEKIFSFSSSKSSNVEKSSLFVNFISYSLISWEKNFFKYFSFPFGSSVLILAKKL